MTSSAFIFLHDMQLFLTFHSRLVSVWNYRGELVTSFDDHLFWHPDCSDNSFCITSNKDLIISYCRAYPKDSSSDENACSINISEIVTGKVFGQNKGR
uniref:Uncharacterized protein n=1 Tax=Arundo donax TaxID=35708 RepID=A0A0A9CKC3_ARUDO